MAPVIPSSGRICERAIIAALGWAGGDLLTFTADAGVVTARRDPGGMVALPASSFIFLCRRWSGTARVQEPTKFSALTWSPLIRPPSPLTPQAGEALRMIRSGQRFSTYGLDDSNPG
jgi:hypothetical protein